MIYIDYNGENQDLYIPRASASSATGSTDNKIVFLTQEEYDALDPKEEKLYVVTDTPAVYVGETFIGPCCTPGGLEDLTISIPDIIVGDGEADIIVTPSDADVDLEFSSSDEDIATIDENGHITVIEDGEVTFCVTDKNSGMQDCATANVERPYFMVSPLSISAPASGGTYIIRITSNYDQPWTAYENSGWFQIPPSSGTGSGQFTLTVEEKLPQDSDWNSGRSGILQIRNGNEVLSIVQVSQEALRYAKVYEGGEELEGNSSRYIIPDETGYTMNLEVVTNNAPWVFYTLPSFEFVASGTTNASVPINFSLQQIKDTPYLKFAWKEEGDGDDWRTWVGPGPEIDIYPSEDIPFSVTPTAITDNGNGGTYVLNVTAIGEWTVTWDAFPTPTPWCDYTPMDGENSGTITVTLGPYTSQGETRTGDLIITDYWGRSITVGVTQEGYVPPAPTQVTVQQLIAEGYANTVAPGGEYKAGTYVQILPTCPYAASQIVNLADVALNQEQLTAGTQNTIVWNQTLPSGWTEQDIVNIYSGQSLNFTPRGEEFWDIKSGTTNFEITYTGDTWVTSDYPWGSYSSEGVFAPRYNMNKESEYAQKGWRQTPGNITVNIDGTFSSVSQVMFTQMTTTTSFTLNCPNFVAQDAVGMFEGCRNLEELHINGGFRWDAWRLCHNVFDGCASLVSIPYSTGTTANTWTREHQYNILYPHNDGVRGSANCRNLFRACSSLEYIGPVINMGAISLSGCTYDGQTQAALSYSMFECPVLTDVRIINLNNNDWNFADSSTFTYIPAMNAASIEYLLSNVEDVTSQGGHTVTFHSRHMGEVSQTAIDAAAAKGWNVAWSTPDAV